MGLSAFSQIAGSRHDFSGESWNTTGEICIVCHTPHNSITSVSNAPLWNHSVTSATFTTYSSVKLDATVGAPDGISKLCLSCHDGTVALENFSGVTTGTNFATGRFNIGTNLSNDHPISFTYNTALATADGGLFDPSTKNVTELGGTIQEKMLYGDKLECSSCHDVHNHYNQYRMLLFANDQSAMCLTCHDK